MLGKDMDLVQIKSCISPSQSMSMTYVPSLQGVEVILVLCLEGGGPPDQ